MYERKIAPTLGSGLDLLREVLGGKQKMSLLYFVAQGLAAPANCTASCPAPSAAC